MSNSVVAAVLVALGAAIASPTALAASDDGKLVLVRTLPPTAQKMAWLDTLTDRCIRFTQAGNLTYAMRSCRAAVAVANSNYRSASQVVRHYAGEAASRDVAIAYSNAAAVSWLAGDVARAQSYVAKSRDASNDVPALERNAAIIETATATIRTAEK